MGAPFIFEASIRIKDLEAAKSEISQLIVDNVVEMIEDSEKRYHITVLVTAEESAVLYKKITQIFDDHTIIENESEDGGIVSIIIEVP